MRRAAAIVVAFAPACSLLVDVDRFDRGGEAIADAHPESTDVAAEPTESDARLDAARIPDVPPPPEAGDPDVVTTCPEKNACEALYNCCLVADDIDGVCFDDYVAATPHQADCCKVLLRERSQHNCP